MSDRGKAELEYPSYNQAKAYRLILCIEDVYQAKTIITIFFKGMDDYDFHKDSLKPNKALFDHKHSRHPHGPKATTERSKSKEKLIITSFSKKQIVELKSNKSPLSNSHHNTRTLQAAESPKASNCQSEYYIKTAETKTQLDPLQLQDEIRLKQGQLQLITGRLAKAQKLINQLMAENRLKTQRIETLERQMNTLLAKSLKNLQAQSFGVDLAYECEKARQDSKRLLKMLQQTAEYEYFSKFALLDNGVQFLQSPNLNRKSSLDGCSAKKPMHYCTCNKQFIPESSFWVSEKIYNFGKEFIKQRKGEFTKSQYELLLYQLNRLWRQREKKIINTLSGQKAREIEKYKRREANYHSLQKNAVQR